MAFENFKKLTKFLKQLDNVEIRLGILKHARYDDAQSVASVLAFHELGTADMPRRSVIREPLQDKKDILSQEIINGFTRFGRKNDLNGFTSHVGQTALSISLKAFDTNGFGRWQALHERTRQQKMKKQNGTVAVLYDTGTLKGHLSYDVEGLK